jgi:hypothetical protein
VLVRAAIFELAVTIENIDRDVLEVLIMASRSRVSTARHLKPLERRTEATGNRESSATAGALAAGTWLRSRGATPPATLRWHVEIALDVLDEPAPSEYDEATATRFHIDIYGEEWGFFFCYRGRSSWIRITDIAFVHGRDDYQLLASVPALKDIGTLIRRLETEFRVRFQRGHAHVRTNLPNLEPIVRNWIATL